MSSRTAALAHLRAVDEKRNASVSAAAVEATRNAEPEPQVEPEVEPEVEIEPDPVEKALTEPVRLPVFTSHSQAFAADMAGKARANREKMADLQSKIDALQAELLDCMRIDSAIAASSASLGNHA